MNRKNPLPVLSEESMLLQGREAGGSEAALRTTGRDGIGRCRRGRGSDLERTSGISIGENKAA